MITFIFYVLAICTLLWCIVNAICNCLDERKWYCVFYTVSSVIVVVYTVVVTLVQFM